MSTSIHEESLHDGNPEVYKEFAVNYEEYSLSPEVNYEAPGSVVLKWKSYHPSATNPKHKIFDAGCGTGLVGEEFAKSVSGIDLELYGGDLSPDMLELAKDKKVYTDLKNVNLKEELPYGEGFFDSIVSAGTFLQGHCGPECLPHIFRVLKRNGYFITSVRKPFYEKSKPEWAQKITESNCELHEEALMPYSALSDGLVLVIYKK